MHISNFFFMDAFEAVRPSMISDIIVSAVKDSGCLLQTSYGSNLFDVLEEFRLTDTAGDQVWITLIEKFCISH